MAMRIPLLSPKVAPNSQKCRVPPKIIVKNAEKLKLFCSNKLGDAELATDLATEVAKMNAHTVETKEAMEKSRAVLFGELCRYVGMCVEEMKERWRKMDDEEKMCLVKSFVSVWGERFHPLSSKSAKEMVEQHLAEETLFSTTSSSPSSSKLSGLKRILGFFDDV